MRHPSDAYIRTSHASAMRSSSIGNLFIHVYSCLPLRNRLLSLIVKLEGGQLFSLTLRTVLKRQYSVDVGPYSYGSLLEPGKADRHTEIGAYVSIGPNVRRIGAAHPMSDLSLHPFWYNAGFGMVEKQSDVERSAISIDHDSWIGANVTILPGCKRIGLGAVVGAGSVVTKDVPDFTIVAGNPAKVIGRRLSEIERKALLEEKPWFLPPREAQRVLLDISQRLSNDSSLGE